MKYRFRFIGLILLMAIFLSSCVDLRFFLPPKKHGERLITDIGSPINDYYTKELTREYPTARNPWKMAIYNGVLYVATGDYTQNSGNTPIFAYDLEEKEWKAPYITADESLEVFREIGGKLYAVGNDSTAPTWEYGNYYELDGEGWLAHKDLPGAVHCFDIIEYDGAKFFGIGTENGGISPVLRADNNGGYSSVEFIKDGESRLSAELLEFCRAYNFFIAGGELYVFLLAPYLDGETQTAYEIFKYDGEKFVYHRALDYSGVGFLRVPDGDKNKLLRQNFFTYEFTKDGCAYFASGYLFKTADFLSFERVHLPNGGAVTDMLEVSGEYYVLSFTKEDDMYKNTVWRMEEGDSFEKVLEFEHEGAYALSFAFDGERFYIGMGNRANTKYVGTVYRTKKINN